MYIFKKYPLREKNPETSSASSAEAVVAEARREGVKLDKARLRENNEHFFQRITEEKEKLGITEDVESSSNIHMNRLNAVMGISRILSSGENESIKKIQEIINERLRGEAKIAEDGILGQGTINALKWYYNIDMEIKGMSPETPSGDVEIYDATIIGRNLSDVADEDKAMTLAEEIIEGFEAEQDQTQRKKLIKEWQEAHLIGNDGKIGKETYVEMRAQKLIMDENGETSVDIINNGLNEEEIRQEILWVLDHGKHTGKNIMGIIAILEAFKENHAKDTDFESVYGDFFKEVDVLGKRFIESAAGKASVRDAEAASASLYGIASDPNLTEMEKVEKILLDPAVLMVGGVLFLFGVFGAGTPYTDGFFKRLGWLIGAAVFGKAAWEKIGGPEILADAKSAIGSPEARAAYESTKENVSEFIGDYVPGVDADSEVTQNAEEKFDSLMAAIRDINLGFLNSDPEKHIEDSRLTALHSLWKSDTLKELSVEALGKISTMADLNGYLSDEQIKALTEAKVEWKDVSNYLKNLVIPKLEGKSFVDTLLAGAADTARTVAGEGIEFVGGKFFENTQLNSIVQSELAPLYLTGSPAEQKASRDFTNAVLSIGIGTLMGNEIRIGARFNQFDIDTYGLTDTEKAEFQKKINKIAFIAEGEQHIREKTKEVYDIQIVETGALVDTAETLKKKIVALDAIKLNDALLTGYGLGPDMFSKDKFQQQFDAKKAELFKKARELGVTEVVFGGTTVVIAAVISGIEKQNTLAADEEVLKSIAEIPKTTATPLDFMNYYKEHESAFERARKIVGLYSTATPGSPEEKLRDEAQARIDLFKINYEKARAARQADIEKFATDIAAITTNDVDETTFLSKRTALESIMQSHIKLRSGVVEGWNIIGEIPQMWAQYQNPFTLEPTKNSFEYLDAVAGITSPKPNVDVTRDLLKKKIAELEQGFVASIDITPVKLDDISSVQAFVQTALLKQESLSHFQTGAKERKWNELQDAVGVLVEQYKAAIVSAPSLTDAEILYSSYVEEVEVKIGANMFGFGGLIENGSAVEDAVKAKGEQFKREETLSTKVSPGNEVYTILSESGFNEFATKYMTNTNFKEEFGKFTGTTLGDYVRFIGGITEVNGWTKEVEIEAKGVLNNIELKMKGDTLSYITLWFDNLKSTLHINN